MNGKLNNTHTVIGTASQYNRVSFNPNNYKLIIIWVYGYGGGCASFCAPGSHLYSVSNRNHYLGGHSRDNYGAWWNVTVDTYGAYISEHYCNGMERKSDCGIYALGLN